MLEFGLANRGFTVALVIGLLFCGMATVPALSALRLPGNDQGYSPVQPIAYSHRLHAGELGISCLYCHQGAESGRYAGVPAASTCMNCHQFVSSTIAAQRAEDEAAKKEERSPKRVISSELKKLYDALGLGSDLKRVPSKELKPLAWERIHKLPDHVLFAHGPHVKAGVSCQTCHGDVQRSERVRQHSDLSMGWCVNCHREVNRNGVDGKPVHASTDCSACHY
ncbi:MAG: cytochrome c3 family protein [Planctomycetota bacterium]|jgi:hypothetical protein|nr:cytochrome c3 family protein [Planctomycetota bacterium]